MKLSAKFELRVGERPVGAIAPGPMGADRIETRDGRQFIGVQICQRLHRIEVLPHPPPQPNIENRTEAEMQSFQKIDAVTGVRHARGVRWAEQRIGFACQPQRAARNDRQRVAAVI